MRNFWIIELAGSDSNRNKALAIYGGNYFPRKFALKRDAIVLAGKLTKLEISYQMIDKNNVVRFIFLAGLEKLR